MILKLTERKGKQQEYNDNISKKKYPYNIQTTPAGLSLTLSQILSFTFISFVLNLLSLQDQT